MYSDAMPHFSCLVTINKMINAFLTQFPERFFYYISVTQVCSVQKMKGSEYFLKSQQMAATEV